MATVSQIGSSIVRQYYQELRLQPHLVNQFYRNVSSMVRVDGNSTLTADTILDIHRIILSLNFFATQILTINSLQSWGGGVLVMVLGNVIVRATGYHEQRKFVQSFFLAPQEKGFFILNDIFQFLEERLFIQDHAAPQLSENKPVSRLRVSNSQVSGYGLKEEAIENMPSTSYQHVGDDIEEYGGFEKQKQKYPEQSTSSQHLGYDPEEDGGFKKQQQKYPEQSTNCQRIISFPEDDGSEEQQQRYPEKQSVTNGTPEQSSMNAHLRFLQNGQTNDVNRDVHGEEPHKETYASLLRAPKRIPAASTSSQPVANPRVPAETKEQAVNSSDEQKSIFLKDLPTCASIAKIEEKFKKFGKIQHDGIFMSRVQRSGTCYGIVDYENTSSVETALKWSPIELEGRRIYIERTIGKAKGVGCHFEEEDICFLVKMNRANILLL